MTAEILTPESPRWSLFVRLLGNPLTEGMPADTLRCGPKHRYAEAVLIELGGIDIDGTLAFSGNMVAIATARSCSMWIPIRMTVLHPLPLELAGCIMRYG